MREAIWAIVLGLVIFPKNVGSFSHTTVNDFMVGWNSVHEVAK